MLNANNKVNYEPSIKQKEKKYSLSTVLAWLYLKTIGRILPRRWNKWAKNILHHNKVIVVNGVQTDNLFNSDREKELKDENEKLQEKLKEMNELTEQVNSLGEEKEIFAKFFAAQAQQIEDLELENEELKSKLTELKKNYRELAEIAQKRGEEFLVQFKEKSEEILHLQKELTERSKEFANKIEMLLVEIEKKDAKIRSLTKLNEVLEQEKKEMETKNNEQKQTIIEEEKRIREQDDLIKSFHKNKDINETVKKENKSLRAQNTELESKFSKLNNESDTQIKQLENQLKEKQAELEQAKKKNTELEDLKKCLEKDKSDSSNKLSAAEKNKKELEDEVNELKEKVQTLEKNRAEIEKQKADLEKKLEPSQGENKELQKQVEHPSAKKEIPNQSVTSKPEGRQQKLQNKQKDASKKPEDINKKTKAGTKSIFSTSGSVKSKFSNTLSKLRGNDSLDKFLSDQNTKLKKSFPEFKEKHFCHNVLKETIKSLSNQGDGKFESDKLLELLKSNLMKSGRAIIEIKVNTVVEKVGKKHSIEQVFFVEEYAKGLCLNEEDSKAVIHSFTDFLAHKNNSNNDSVKKFVVQKLTEAEMECFSDKVQVLASSIRDKFLSPDEKMCSKISEENNEYQLTEKAKKEYKLNEVNHMPNSSMSYSNTTNVSKGRFK
uniref:Uncharacterized protein n=1 Tax=Wolbachia endosymbiont of Oeneis ivallda TaxID=3171168 RepID=A0AAU7YKS5_9RICK